jgi:hypothetical protein
MKTNELGKGDKEEENSEYEKICELIWNLKKEAQKPMPGGSARKAVFPLVRRKEVALLIVGKSPNDNGVPYAGDDKQQTKEHAKRYEFIRRSPSVPFNPTLNHKYYDKLIAFVRAVDKRLGVWWEIQESQKELCVEFADALPLATKPRTRDFDTVIDPLDPACPVRESCKVILSAILDYYKPRVILAHGRFPVELLRELYDQSRHVLLSTSTFIVSQNEQRQIHLSPFIDDNFDERSRERLLMEMKTQWPYRNGS